MHTKTAYGFIGLIVGCSFAACTVEADSPTLEFVEYSITHEAQLWWAWTLADINADGRTDVVVQHNNGSGGWLGWYEGPPNPADQWLLHGIADSLEDGRRFAAGDLDTGDFDGDGDTDVLGVVHPGEWTNAIAPATLFWFENPTWERHPIGQIPNALKDVNLADFNGDGALDVVAITFEENYLTLFEQQSDQTFAVAQQMQIPNLHEGMDTCDPNGDGHLDIATNGYWLMNPGTNSQASWSLLTIDPVWHSQDGDWSRNATKVACADFDGDGRDEVLVSHSERTGYPVARYRLDPATTNTWEKHIVLDSLVAAHTLQVADIDLDGTLDVFTGVNRSRAINLDQQDFPVYVLRNLSSGWDAVLVHEAGIYNGRLSDYEGDGDMDIFRYPTHDDTLFHVMINNTVKTSSPE